MSFKAQPLPELLDRIEAFHGSQAPSWPVDPYEFLIWWHCGYPASDERCARGWQALKSQKIGIQPAQLLAASQAKLSAALKPGGMVPEIRALRLQQIAQRVIQEFDGDLTTLFTGRISAIRTSLKKFPGISDPGSDRILLFARVAPIAAVPSNCPHVPVRMMLGLEDNYSVTYREAQSLIQEAVPEQFHTRQRAYLLLKAHGQTICKAKPRCDRCPVSAACAYAAGQDRGGIRRKGQ
jgi:endonuclease III